MIEGFVAPGFEAVLTAFAAGFDRTDDLREVGAAVAIVHRGELVVSLWGGLADVDTGTPWRENTIANVWSTTKGITAAMVAIAVDRGLIDYAAPVARYWPEFAASGKAEVTVAQLLSHQAGLPGFPPGTTLEDLYAWDPAVERLAAHAPMWAPGTHNSYHAITFGHLAGELLQRAAGRRFPDLLADYVAGPLEADIHIALEAGLQSRLATMISPLNPAPFDPDAMAPEAIAAVTNPTITPDLANFPEWRAAVIPAANGHASALGLARLYGALAYEGQLGRTRLLGADAIAAMRTVQTTRTDGFLGVPAWWAMGMTTNHVGAYGPEPSCYGHGGWGGSFGVADPVSGTGIGYVMNQMGAMIVGDPRNIALMKAIHAATH
jgi:CubicO group peptidase (beta-lactamase class C family)